MIFGLMSLSIRLRYLRQYDLSKKVIENMQERQQQTQLQDYLYNSPDAIIIYAKTT
jgi:hypothetical protein